VHDELDSGVPPTAAGAEAARELVRIMESAYPLSVPVLAGCDLGRSWGQLQEYEPAQIDPRALALLLPSP
jgi:DNA polymerase I-like protein with 3'-5' exonuclease and polymerase domains